MQISLMTMLILSSVLIFFILIWVFLLMKYKNTKPLTYGRLVRPPCLPGRCRRPPQKTPRASQKGRQVALTTSPEKTVPEKTISWAPSYYFANATIISGEIFPSVGRSEDPLPSLLQPLLLLALLPELAPSTPMVSAQLSSVRKEEEGAAGGGGIGQT